MAVHTILYFGHFDRNFRNLLPTTAHYLDKDLEHGLPDKASSKVDGFSFRYMELQGKQFVAVGVDTLVLRVPVLLDPARHTDGKGFFSPPQFGDLSAARLLVDMVVWNPEQRDLLAEFIRKLPPENR